MMIMQVFLGKGTAAGCLFLGRIGKRIRGFFVGGTGILRLGVLGNLLLARIHEWSAYSQPEQCHYHKDG